VKKAERYQKILEYFMTNQPVAETELVFASPYELLVSVILSAQCTDKRVNMITPAFFRRFPDAPTLSGARQEEVFGLIRSCSYPNNKAKNLIGMAQALTHKFAGVMPSEVDELLTLPGVGRKTANVLASVLFNKPALAVDTHVHRVSARIGLTVNAKNPLQTELQLVKHIPPSQIPLAHHWLILHGRYVCIARKPKCAECGISRWCKYFDKNTRAAVVNKSKRGT
jgi:endonuclease-3